MGYSKSKGRLNKKKFTKGNDAGKKKERNLKHKNKVKKEKASCVYKRRGNYIDEKEQKKNNIS